MRIYILLLILLPAYSIAQLSKRITVDTKFNSIADDYVRLGLAIGEYDSDFVDAYYGPDLLKPTTIKQVTFPKDSFLNAVSNLQLRLQPYLTKTTEATLNNRAKWMSGQLTAFTCRIKMFSGEIISFDKQTKELFGVDVPVYNEDYLRSLLNQLNAVLPGQGSINNRYQELANHFIIPKEKLDTLLKVTIAESKKRTKQHFILPANEDFKLEYVTDKPWSGYNWYQGNYKSRIQFNTDVTSYVDRIIDIASHEGYPGHHVYNSGLEKELYHDKGWVEVSLYPLFCPQSLIAEGSANYGVEMAFPGDERMNFAKNHLLNLAGIDTTGLYIYFNALAIKGKLQNARMEVARRVTDGKMTEPEATRWLMEYALYNEKDAVRYISFIKKYQAYVINYTYGMDLVQHYIEGYGEVKNNMQQRWKLFQWLLTNEVMPSDLMESKK
ncbi:MAG: hypothetical protein ABI772_05255 [Bacteroidota bacterium]